jgi:hypothetical protein
VAVKVLEALEAEMMQIKYRCTARTFTDHTVSDGPYPRDDYQGADIYKMAPVLARPPSEVINLGVILRGRRVRDHRPSAKCCYATPGSD